MGSSSVDLLLTVHRVELREISTVRERFAHQSATCNEAALLAAIANATLGSYDQPLAQSEATLDAFESGLFDGDGAPSLHQAHDLKRRVSLTRRILWQTANVIQKLMPASGPPEPLFQDVRESVDAYLFWADQLLEEVNLLLQVHLAMASHRTTRSCASSPRSRQSPPATFIAGVYGMNFDTMPELRNRFGYPAVMILMAVVAGGIMLWFRRRGWLRGRGG